MASFQKGVQEPSTCLEVTLRFDLVTWLLREDLIADGLHLKWDDQKMLGRRAPVNEAGASQLFGTVPKMSHMHECVPMAVILLLLLPQLSCCSIRGGAWPVISVREFAKGVTWIRVGFM